jgi:putative inorganic carbon (HCO3(-)) transporter
MPSRLKNTGWAPPPTALSQPKWNNWLGLLFFPALGCLFAWLFQQDLLLGLIFFALIMAFCVVIFCFIKVDLAYFLLLIIGWFGAYFCTYATNGNLPVGLIFDCIVLVNFLALLGSRRDVKASFRQFIKEPVILLSLLGSAYGVLEIFNPNAGLSSSNWLGVRKVIEMILLQFTAYCLFDNYRMIRRYTFAVLIVSTLCAAYGCFQEWHGLAPWELSMIMSDPHTFALLWAGGEFRKFSTLYDPAAFGILMAVCAIFFIILGINEQNRRLRITYFACVIPMILGMGYSGTRTAYAILLAGIVFFILFNIDKPAIRKFGAFMVVVFLAVMFGPFSGNGTIRRFRTTFLGTKDESYKVRIIARAFIKPYIQRHPFGGGLGTTGFNGALEHPGNPLAGFMPDGAYVQRAAELGWIGLLINVILYFLILKTGIQAFFRVKDPRIKVYYAAAVSCIFAFYVGDYAQLAVGGPADICIYFMFIAMILKRKDYDKEYELHPTA